MEHRNSALKKSIEKQLKEGSQNNWKQLVNSYQAVDIVDELEHHDPDRVAQLLIMLPDDKLAYLFKKFHKRYQDKLLKELSADDEVRLFESLAKDERGNLYRRLPEEVQQRILLKLAKHEQDDVLVLSEYQDGTAGALVTSAYVSVPPDMSVAEALNHVRDDSLKRETIYQIYVVDEHHSLLGTLSLRELMGHNDDVLVKDIMHTDVITVSALAPQREAARVIRRYDFLSVPVVKGEDRLVGIVTVDDAMDVDVEESTEDFHKGGGSLSFKDLSILKASPWLIYRKRVFWLVILIFANLFSGGALDYFEETIEAHVALVFFLPLLVDSGGNAGTQASTLMVRALSVGDVQPKDWIKMLGKEAFVALGLGLTMAFVVYFLGVYRGGTDIALVVSLAMVLIVMAGSLIGMLMPFAFSHTKMDPATASAPLITSIADTAGVLIYFSIAVTILNV